MKIKYFAWIRERLGKDEEDVQLPSHVINIDTLLEWLKGRDAVFEGIMQQPGLIRVALDQEHAPDRNTSIVGVNEVALFPPMTGG